MWVWQCSIFNLSSPRYRSGCSHWDTGWKEGSHRASSHTSSLSWEGQRSHDEQEDLGGYTPRAEGRADRGKAIILKWGNFGMNEGGSCGRNPAAAMKEALGTRADQDTSARDSGQGHSPADPTTWHLFILVWLHPGHRTTWERSEIILLTLECWWGTTNLLAF